MHTLFAALLAALLLPVQAATLVHPPLAAGGSWGSSFDSQRPAPISLPHGAFAAEADCCDAPFAGEAATPAQPPGLFDDPAVIARLGNGPLLAKAVHKNGLNDGLNDALDNGLADAALVKLPAAPANQGRLAEPGSLALVALGLLGAVLLHWREVTPRR